MATHPVFLPGESHGQRSLVGYSSCGHKESDTTDVTKQQPIFYHNKKIQKTGSLCVHMATVLGGAQTDPLLRGRHLWVEDCGGRSSLCFSISCLFFGMGYILLFEWEKFQIQKA